MSKQSEGSKSSRFDLSSEEITSEPLYRVLMYIATPLLVQNLVWVIQQIVDLFWIGQFSSIAVSAIGLVLPATSLLLVTVISIPFIGTQILVSQELGSGNKSAARRISSSGVIISVLFAVCLGALAYAASQPLLEILLSYRQEPESNIILLAKAYLQILAIGVVFAAVSDVLEATFISWGRSRYSLYINIVNIVVNLSLDPILIFGIGPIPVLGVRGAAIASVGGYVSGLIIAVSLALFYDKNEYLSFDITHSAEYIKLLKVGVPAGVRDTIVPIADLIFIGIVFTVGGAAGSAAYIVGSRVASVANLLAESLETATRSIVGQNAGANYPHRANRMVWVSTSIITIVLSSCGIMQWLSANFIVSTLSPELEGSALDLAATCLRIYALGYPGLGLIAVIQAGFDAGGRTTVGFVASLLKYWVIQIPIALVSGLILDYSVVTLFWAIALSNTTVAIILVWYYYTTQKKLFK